MTTGKYISAHAWGDERLKAPKFKAAYDAFEDEFALAGALIEARSKADMTQEQVAAAMGMTQTDLDLARRRQKEIER